MNLVKLFDDEDYFLDTSYIDENKLNVEISDIVSLQYKNFNNDLSMNTIIEPSTNFNNPRRQRKVTNTKSQIKSWNSYSKFSNIINLY